MGASLLRHAREVRSPSRSKSRNTAIVFRVPIEVQAVAGPPRGFRTRVVASRSLTPTTRAIELEKPQAFTFRPTQFTFLQLKTEEGMDARPVSLASRPTRPHLEYAVRISDSPYKRAFAALQPGDEVAVFGPIGDFVLHETRPAVLLAGGIGITPLKGMAEYAADNALPIPIGSSTVTGVRTRSCIDTNSRRSKSRTPGSACSTPSPAPRRRGGKGQRDGLAGNLSKRRRSGLTPRSTTSAAHPLWSWEPCGYSEAWVSPNQTSRSKRSADTNRRYSRVGFFTSAQDL